MANLSASPNAAWDAQDIDRARAADTPRAGAATARRGRLLHSATRRFAVAGFAFGALFPIFAALLSLFVDRLPLNPASLLEAQRTQPLLWIIDTAPFVLSVFAALAGRREDQLLKANDRLRRLSQELEQHRAQQTIQLDERTAQLEAAVEVGRAVTSILDADKLIRQVVQLITDRFGFYYAAVFTLDDSGRFAVLREATGEAGRALKQRGHKLEVGGQSMVGDVTAHHKPRIALDVGQEAVRFANPLLPETRSEIALPLAVGNRVLGALDVQSTQEAAFDETGAAVLQSMADQIAIALDNAALYSESQGNVGMLNGLLALSTDIAGSRTLHDLTRRAARHLKSMLGADSYYVALVDEPQTRIRFVLQRRSDMDPQDMVVERPFGGGPGLIEHVIQMRRPLRFDAAEAPAWLAQLSGAASALQPRAFVGVPILHGERVLGILAFQDFRPNASFDEYHERVAAALANQLAVALDNLRLTEEIQRALDNLDAANQQLTGQAWQRYAQARVLSGEWRSGEWRPASAGARTSADSAPDEPGTLKLPLSVRGQTIGRFDLAPTDERRSWSADDIAFAESLVDQVGQTIETARLLDETQASLAETTQLYQVGRALAAASHPLDVAQIVVDALHGWLKVDQVGLVLFDAERGYGTLIAEAVRTPDRESVRIPMAGNPTYDLLAHDQQPVAVYDVAHDPMTAAVADVLLPRHVNSILLLPLLVGQHLIGSIGIDAHTPRRFLDREIALCETLARQAAVALENRRLFEETQRRVEIESALNQISRTLRASLDPQAVFDLQATIAEMGGVMRASRCFYLSNDDDHGFACAYEWCAPGVASFQGAGRSWADWPQVFQQLKAGQPLVITDVEREDLPELKPAMRDRGVLSHVHVPVLTGNRLIGILGFDQVDRERRWLPEEVNLVQRVADQLAVALDNARLYQSVRSRVNELTALTRIGRRLAATLQLEEVLNAIVEEALTVTPADRGSIALYDVNQDALELRVLIGYPEAALQRVRDSAYHRLRRADGLHGRLLATGQAVLSNDVQNDPAYLMADGDTRSELIVPIKQGDTLLGALNLESPRRSAFGESDQRLIEALADQAAVAIVNARAYAAERAALERMREVDRLKTQFLANMSHELRTPLNSILGFSRVILRGIDGPLTELQQADLTAIHNSGQHLLGLINDILDLSKIEAGKMELAMEDVDLADIVKGVMSTAIALVKDKPIKLHQELPAQLPPIKADSRRIRQVILNLVSNAAKFTDKGQVLVRVVAHPQEVQVVVSDTGIGIPADKLDSVFEEFTQVDASATRKAGGSGLGLAISRRFVEMHGGRIWAESQLGVGSTFAFSLPLERPAEAPLVAPAAEQAAPASDRKRVLCIDDDPGVITLYRRYLEKQGYQVIGLNNAANAVQEAKRLQPAAITLDVMMPNRDGWTALADLKSAPETSRIPIIVCSIVEAERKGFALGAADYLVKPITEGDLRRALDRVNHRQMAQTVLVIDDDAEARQLIRRMLEARPGCRIIEAQGGAQGIAQVQAHRPDVVILDLMMPEVDGFAVLETIKGNRLSRGTPVIIVTAKELADEDRARLQGKTAALLNKGRLDAEALLAELSSALNAMNGRQSSPPRAHIQPAGAIEHAPGR